jgi:hypothetical protein
MIIDYDSKTEPAMTSSGVTDGGAAEAAGGARLT